MLCWIKIADRNKIDDKNFLKLFKGSLNERFAKSLWKIIIFVFFCYIGTQLQTYSRDLSNFSRTTCQIEFMFYWYFAKWVVLQGSKYAYDNVKNYWKWKTKKNERKKKNTQKKQHCAQDHKLVSLLFPNIIVISFEWLLKWEGTHLAPLRFIFFLSLKKNALLGITLS